MDTHENQALANPLAGSPASGHYEAALAHRKIAKAYEIGAKKLEDAARAMQLQIDAAQEALEKIEIEARKAKQGQAANANLAQSENLKAIGAMAQQVSPNDPEFKTAVSFLEVDLAATRKFAKAVRGTWTVGDTFKLVPEPANAADPDAIMVFCGTTQVGYVSREGAQDIKALTQKEGWTLCGPAFLKKREGGKWNEGELSVRLESAVAGWAHYNPTLPLELNLARMQRSLLAKIAPEPTLDPSAPKRSHSL